MANEVTLADLRARALDYADMTNSEFPDDDRVRDYINSGLSELHDILVMSFADYFRKVESISITSGTEAYKLPDDFYKASAVYYVTSDRRWSVDRFSLSGIDGYKTGPVQGGSVELWYVPQLNKLTKETDPVSVAVPVGWEDFVALHAAIRLLQRAESDSSPLERERERQRQRILAAAEPRDVHRADSVQDLGNRWSGGRHVLHAPERQFAYRLLGNNIHFVELEHLGV